MYISDLASTATNSVLGGRVFLYEIIIPQGKDANSMKLSQRRRVRFFVKVPYGRMQQVMRQVGLSGGKIISVKLLNAENTTSDVLSNLPWWVEIKTLQPQCLYYFGPFDSLDEAQLHQSGYVEDLQREEAQEIYVAIKQLNPKVLTIE
jgi:hypothetical protein